MDICQTESNPNPQLFRPEHHSTNPHKVENLSHTNRPLANASHAGAHTTLSALSSDCWQWMQENMAKPAYNPGIAEPLNALANIVNRASHVLGAGTLAPQLSLYDGTISNNSHAEIGAKMAEDICRRLKTPNDRLQEVVELVRLHMQMHEVAELRKAKLVALLGRPDIQHLIALQHADATGTGRPDCETRSRKSFLKGKLQELSTTANECQWIGAPPLVTGDTLIKLGYKPGKGFKDMLKQALDAQREGTFNTVQEATEWVRRLFGSPPPESVTS